MVRWVRLSSLPGNASGALLAALLLLAGTARARADETEQRTFSIEVGGKPAGDCRMTITRHDDGSEELSTQAAVRVRVLLTTYTYTFQGTEVWKAGRLSSLKSTCDDNGKHFEVTATAEKDGLRMRINNEERVIRPEVWTTSFWKLADARYHNQPLVLLDADRGAQLSRRLLHVASEDISAAGQVLKCSHFRVLGGPSPIDLWFDAQQRLVRQDFVEQGYRTVIHLSAVNR